MIIKARFIAVDEIRPYVVEDKVSGTKHNNWSVSFLIEFEVEGQNGSFKQQMVVETTYDQEPNLKVGPLDSSRLYEMRLSFSVYPRKDGTHGQNIRLSRYTEVNNQPQS